MSPFVSTKKEWTNEEYKLPEDLIKGIIELGWERPSRIQTIAIPYIIKPDEESNQFESLIAQAKNGSGKSGAFIIGSLLRVDTTQAKNQVIMVGHTRELVN